MLCLMICTPVPEVYAQVADPDAARSAVLQQTDATATEPESLPVVSSPVYVPQVLKKLLGGNYILPPVPDSLMVDMEAMDTLPYAHPADTLAITVSRFFVTMPHQRVNVPVIFDTYEFPAPLTLADAPDESLGYYTRRLAEMALSDRLFRIARHNLIVNRPDLVRYNTATMPVPPKHFRAVVQPGTSEVKIEEIKLNPGDPAKALGATIERKNWIHEFDASLQFSQAYVSPNWYQGGKSNLNLIGNLVWSVKLNSKLHPNIKFESTVLYNVGLNSAPEDTVRKYNLSQDLFQANSLFGLKAAKYWYYSVNATLKTQLLNHYPTNSRNIQASFMSPGQFNSGIGMTYNYSTKRTSINLTISPLSYDLKTCINPDLNETSFGIKEGRKSVSTYGSNVEVIFGWQLRYNIRYDTRLFAFTNYSYAQADWQNTLKFNVTTYLQTQLAWNLRFDTQTKRLPDSKWHRYQLKEILSFGLSYKFRTA